MTADVDGEDENDRSSVEEATFDDPADEQDDGALDEPADGLDEMEMAGNEHKRKPARPGAPVELSRSRRYLYLLKPVTGREGVYCICLPPWQRRTPVDPEQLETKATHQEYEGCLAYAELAGGISFGAVAALAFIPLTPKLMLLLGSAAPPMEFLVGMMWVEAGRTVGKVLGLRLCPKPGPLCPSPCPRWEGQCPCSPCPPCENPPCPPCPCPCPPCPEGDVCKEGP